MKYHIITFGCQMNKSDSERMAAVLENKGFETASKMREADLVIVNMCSVRQSAVDRVYGLYPKFKAIKAKNPNFKTVLAGCILKKDKPKFKKFFDSFWNQENLSILPPIRKTKAAFIPISNGCNNFCTYCAVPYARGRLKCRKHSEILKEAKGAINKGYKEIWLLGQNVNDYSSGNINFAELLKTINAIPGQFKIFFTSPHPKNFSNDLISVLAECEKYSRYLNLPVQSGDNEILKRMNRNYTIKQYEDLVKKIRKKMPNINLSTDVIVGFPGETKNQFNNTAKLFRKIKFNIAYISKYSPRPGTATANIKDNISIEEKKRREKVLTKIISNYKN